MDRNELIITTAKDLLIKAMDKDLIELTSRGGEDSLGILGDYLKTMAAKVSDALKGLDH